MYVTMDTEKRQNMEKSWICSVTWAGSIPVSDKKFILSIM